MNEETRPLWTNQADRSTGDELHNQIRALQLPAYPQVCVYTDIATAFSTSTDIIIYMVDGRMFTYAFTVTMPDREVLKKMIEDGSLIAFLTEKTAHYFSLRRAQ